LRRARPLSH